jgi:hypothetical protein
VAQRLGRVVGRWALGVLADAEDRLFEEQQEVQMQDLRQLVEGVLGELLAEHWAQPLEHPDL